MPYLLQIICTLPHLMQPDQVMAIILLLRMSPTPQVLSVRQQTMRNLNEAVGILDLVPLCVSPTESKQQAPCSEADKQPAPGTSASQGPSAVCPCGGALMTFQAGTLRPPNLR